MSQRLNLSIELGKQPAKRSKKGSDTMPLTFVVLGCFAQPKDSDNLLGKAKNTLYRIEQDNFDAILTMFNPSLKVDLGGFNEAVHLSFENLEELHPDRLLKQLPLPDFVEQEQPQPHSDQGQPSVEQNESDQQILSRLLGESSLSRSPGNAPSSQGKSRLIESVVGRLVNESLQANADGEKARNPLQTHQQQTRSEQLKALLHHPSFQSLESLWRGLDWLCRNLEADEENEIYLLNLPGNNWIDLTQPDFEIDETDLYKILQTRVSERSSLEQKLILICDKYFAPSTEDISLLERLGQIAESLDAQLIAGAADSFIPEKGSDTDDFSEWTAFQNIQIANRVNLVLPRVLLRLPYGEQYDPVESIPFEELDQEWSATDLLWGNPAFAMAVQFAADNQSNRTQEDSVLTDCPAFAYKKDNESHLQPCTEHLFREGQLAKILDLGLIPIIGSRRSNVIKLPWHPQL